MSNGVSGLLGSIADIGQDRVRGGYSRPVYSTAELDLRTWFIAEAERRGLDVEVDQNGIIWAWWDVPSRDRSGALMTGSHLDSVPGGGAFDGPLGVASALSAIDLLRSQGRQPERAVVIAVFPEEEGSRYGIACLGSRLLTGAIPAARALALKDETGTTFAEHSRAAGLDPTHMGENLARLSGIAAFIELHVEQGRGLIDLGQPVAIGSSILGHGRWRIRFEGQGNHAGTTLMADRSDPLVAAAGLIAAIPAIAKAHERARATVGRVEPVPGGTNVIASRVDVWLDVRHPDDATTAAVVGSIAASARDSASAQGCTATIHEESLSPTVDFDVALRSRLEAELPAAPVLDTGAGHDAGILAAHMPTAMLFVRNPTGISHAHEEHVEDADAETGAAVLADVLMSDVLGPVQDGPVVP